MFHSWRFKTHIKTFFFFWQIYTTTYKYQNPEKPQNWEWGFAIARELFRGQEVARIELELQTKIQQLQALSLAGWGWMWNFSTILWGRVDV